MESDNGSQSDIAVEGIFDPQNNKSGVLLNPKYNGKSRPTDPFVPRELVRRFKLKRGSYVAGKGQADGKHPNPKVRFIETLDGMSLEERRQQLTFEQLTTIAPDSWLRLERSGSGNMTCRVMDIFCPIGKGQRGLIVAPPAPAKPPSFRTSPSGSITTIRNARLSCSSSMSVPRK
jgi:transcription termination factor Rho